jgi:REP-associated tyrosine transposase
MYRRNLPHIQKDDASHFVSFKTRDNIVLTAEARDLVLQHCLHDNHVRYDLHAAVVMPNHVHLIFTPLRDRLGNSFSLATIMSGIKGASAHSINKVLKRRGSLWLDESFDRVIRAGADFQDKVAYVLGNPLRHKLVDSLDQYRWVWREAE